VENELENARLARRSLERACQMLERPGAKALNASAAEITKAITFLTRVESAWQSSERRPGQTRELASEIEAVRRELRKAQALLEAAGKFYAVWARLMGLGPEDSGANYTCAGEPCQMMKGGENRTVLHG